MGRIQQLGRACRHNSTSIMETKLVQKKGDIFISPFSYLIFTRFNRNALDNTESELIAMAAPAKTGLK